MSTASGHRHISLLRLLLAPLLLAAPGVGSSHSGMNAIETGRPGAVPGNTDAGRYGSAWECARGFEKLAEGCVAIKVPANADLNSFGSGRGCKRGYLQVGERCPVVKVPGNAHADDQAFGPGWECNRGYLEVSGVCTRIIVPSNAYAADSAFSRGWECNRGFRRDGGRCAAVTVPADGFLQRAGDDRDCDRDSRRPVCRSRCPRTLTWIGQATAGNASADSGSRTRSACRCWCPQARTSKRATRTRVP